MKTIHEHGTLLSTPSFYKTYHNHGIFQDMALTAIAQTFPQFSQSGSWKTLANTRLQTQIAHSITPDAVHLEHSPGYQSYMYDTFARFLFGGRANRFVLPSGMANLEDMPKQLTYLIKPKQHVAHLRDTSGSPRSASIIPNTADYRSSHSRSARQERHTADADVKAHQHAIQLHARVLAHPTRAFNQATQIMMTAGYHSSAHKHQDDLTIDVYGLGRDFIIETGRFGYTNLPQRQHVFKVEAHNTVHRDGRRARPQPCYAEKSRIVS